RMDGRARDSHVGAMDAIDLLKEQHEEVRNLFAELVRTDDPEERETIFQDIADTLAAHATIEEALFYPIAYDREPKAIEHAAAEHFVMKKLIADMISLSVEDPSFDANLAVLHEQVEHHVDQEETELFATVRQNVSA